MLTEGTLVAGRYRVSARLGQGGMGAVYLVRDENLGRPAALKVFAARPEETSLARFRREARIMARLRHPNLAAVYDTVEVDGLPALVQEYVEGRDLQEFVFAGETLDEECCRRLLAQMASALALLHASGVVHRDVKPGNVMLEPSGRFRLMDLGLARAEDMTAVTETGSIVGTPMFVAPNVLLSLPAGPPDDVYALGLLVNIMGTGTHLHGPIEEGRSFLVAVAQGRFGGRQASPELPPDLARVVNACCRLDPAARPRDGEAVLALMESGRGRSPGGRDDGRLTARLPRAAEPEGAAPNALRLRRVGGAVGLALALLLCLGLAWLRPRGAGTSPAPPPPLLTLAGVPEARLGLATLDLRWTASGGDGLVDLTVEAAGERVGRRGLRAGRCTLRLPGPGLAGEPTEVRWRLHDGSRTLAEGAGRSGYVERGTLAGAAGLPAVGGPEVAPLPLADGVVVAATPGVLACLEVRHGPDGPSVALRWRQELPQPPYPSTLPGQAHPPGRRYAHAVAAMVASEPGTLVVATRSGRGGLELREAASGAVAARVGLDGGVGGAAGASLAPGVQVWAVETGPPPPGGEGVGLVRLLRTRVASSSLAAEPGESVGPGEPLMAAAVGGRWFLALVTDEERVDLLVADGLALPGPRLVGRWPMGPRARLGVEEAPRAALVGGAGGAVAVVGGSARLLAVPAGGGPPGQPPLTDLGLGDEAVPGSPQVLGPGRFLLPVVVPALPDVPEPVRVVLVEADPARGSLAPPRRLGGVVAWPLRFCAGLSLVRGGGTFLTHVGGVFLADGAGAPDGLAALYGLGEVETRQPLVVLDGTLLGFGRQGQVLGMDLVDGVD